MIHKDGMGVWGIGIAVAEGPVLPVSGKQWVVMWPEMPGSIDTAYAPESLDYFPEIYLVPISPKGTPSADK